MRLILESAVRQGGRLLLGTLLMEIGQHVGGVELNIERDTRPTEPMSFE